MLHSQDVPLSQSALLVIDIQDSFKHDADKWKRRNNLHFEERVAALIQAYRAAGLPVAYFLHTDDDPGFEKDGPSYKLMDFLKPLPSEPIFHKSTRNVFTSTDLIPWLLAQGTRRIAITGIQMEQCCETSARVAADLGYAVDFVMDGTLTFPITNWDVPGTELGVDAIEERTAYALRKRFARIVQAGQLIQELGAAA